MTSYNIGESNGSWKGPSVSYKGLHQWVRTHLENKPLVCPGCNREKPLVVSNISGEYRRDLTDWEWICHRCNLRKDWHEKRFLGELLHPYRWRSYPRNYPRGATGV